jgi:hypothetical protein
MLHLAIIVAERHLGVARDATFEKTAGMALGLIMVCVERGFLGGHGAVFFLVATTEKFR